MNTQKDQIFELLQDNLNKAVNIIYYPNINHSWSLNCIGLLAQFGKTTYQVTNDNLSIKLEIGNIEKIEPYKLAYDKYGINRISIIRLK